MVRPLNLPYGRKVAASSLPPTLLSAAHPTALPLVCRNLALPTIFLRTTHHSRPPAMCFRPTPKPKASGNALSLTYAFYEGVSGPGQRP